MENKDEYYIGVNDFSECLYQLENVISISEQSIKYIIGLISNHYKVRIRFDYRDIKYLEILKEDNKVDFFIREQSDEYFIIYFNYPVPDTIKQYRCDQIDGVRELLEDLYYI